MSIVTRHYSFDVAVMQTIQSKSGPRTDDLLAIFKDCDVAVEEDTDKAVAAGDRFNATTEGFDFDVSKGRGWTVRIGAVLDDVASGSATVASRTFGWDATVVTAGSDVLSLFKNARVNLTKELVEARAVVDTLPIYAGGADGWKYPRVKSKRLELEVSAVVDGAPQLFEYGIVASGNSPGDWRAALSYNLTGGGIVVSGSGVPTGSGLRYPGDSSEQSIRIASQGKPTITAAHVVAPKLIVVALEDYTSDVAIFGSETVRDALYLLRLSNPAGGTFEGLAHLSEASLEFPDSAAMQGATYTGFGPLVAVAP